MSFFLLILSLFFAASAQALPDNIVLVICDDCGVDRIGAYDVAGEHNPAVLWNTSGPTPTINALATAGMRFNRFSAEPWCSPARASILTGRHPFRHGAGTALQINAAGDPDKIKGLSAEEPNIAKKLVEGGYRTAIIGKQHMEGGSDPALPTWALRAGFQVARGLLGNVAGSFTINSFSGNYNKYEWCDNGSCSILTTPYLTTKTVDEAISVVDNDLALHKPYFLWLAFNAPHIPFHCPLTGHSFGPTCAPGSDSTLHKAMLETLDTELARFLTHVNYADTTVIFIGDNGTQVSATSAPFNIGHAKSTVYQGGVRTPLIVRGHAVAPGEAGTVANQSIHVTDLSATILDIAGLSSNTMTDAISFKSYLSNHADPSIRNTTFAQAFTPTGLPYVPDPTKQDDRVGELGTFRLIELASGASEEFYDTATDYFEAAPLNTGALTTPQQDAYDALKNVANMPNTLPTVINRHRKIH